MAVVLYTLKKNTELSLLAHQAKRAIPLTSSCFFISALLLHLCHSYSDAIKCYQSCLLLHPKHSQAWNLLGQIYLETGQTTLAFQSFQQALHFDDADSTCHYHMGLLYELLQSPNNSLEEYQRACELRPYDPHLRVAMGEVYLSMNDLKKAEECYLLAESLGDEEGICSRRLGDLYVSRDELKSAYYYKRFLKKKKNVICDEESYRCAIALCHYYKQRQQLEEMKSICELLLSANDEGAQREARKLMDCTIFPVCYTLIVLSCTATTPVLILCFLPQCIPLLQWVFFMD